MGQYRGPTGETRDDPDEQFLAETLSKQAEYWAQGGGESCLEVEDASERMIFFKDEPYGIFLMMHPDYAVVKSPAHESHAMVFHHIGGEPMAVPISVYMSEKAALQLLLQFLDTGRRPKSVEWEDL